MAELSGQMGELTFTVQVKRAVTGDVEEHVLIGKITQEEAQALGIETGDKPNEE